MKLLGGKVAFLSMILLWVCSLGFIQVSGAQLSESDSNERARNLSYALDNRLRALQQEFSELGNSTAADARRGSIPLDMENAVQNYQFGMRILITDTKDENVRRKLQILLEEKVSSTKRFVSDLGSHVKARNSESARKGCLDNAYKNYRENWANTCRINGMFGDCALSSDVARNLEENHRHSQDECSKRYSP